MNGVVPPASPAVRKLARENGVSAEKLAAELGQTSVSASDVMRKANGGQPAASGVQFWDVDHSLYGPGEWVELSKFNQLAAANLAAAQSLIPAVTHHDRADVSAVENFRKSLAGEARERGVRLTALAFHVKALAQTLKAFPKFNASLSPDGKRLWQKGYCDIGIAVDTPHGLMVPVVRGVWNKGLWAVAEEITDLAGRARERKVRPDEMGGASMSITNLGGIGGTGFSPIVNPPEVAILGITRTSIEPVWDGEAFQPAPMCPLDLSYDHRVINGAEAARFMTHYAGLLADPRRLLL
jgi:pyruvate dehydrogenase E2 component (dihydrolipoamide acetyltransferase)